MPQNEDGSHNIIENSFRRGRVVEKAIGSDRLATLDLYERPEDPALCLQRAESALGETYNMITNNCETFANRCVHGGTGASSRQVKVATGHAALATATCGGAWTALTVGLITTHTIIVSVPAWGIFGWLGMTYPQTQTVTAAHPLGVAAASGACCSGGIWACFSAVGRDPRKSRKRAKANRL